MDDAGEFDWFEGGLDVAEETAHFFDGGDHASAFCGHVGEVGAEFSGFCGGAVEGGERELRVHEDGAERLIDFVGDGGGGEAGAEFFFEEEAAAFVGLAFAFCGFGEFAFSFAAFGDVLGGDGDDVVEDDA